MSRVGRKPIEVPQGVDIKIEKNTITVTKDQKSLVQAIHPSITIAYNPEQKTIEVNRPSNNKLHRSLHGLFRSLVSNMVVGLTAGFNKHLEIVGVGYRAELKGRNLVLSLGYSHSILFKPPKGIDIVLENPTNIIVKGFDKQLVGQVSAKIRSFRPPEPYKGKGIKYKDEIIRRKAGKTAA